MLAERFLCYIKGIFQVLWSKLSFYSGNVFRCLWLFYHGHWHCFMGPLSVANPRHLNWSPSVWKGNKVQKCYFLYCKLCVDI